MSASERIADFSENVLVSIAPPSRVGLPRTVFLVGAISLFADISSEMAYPLVPLLVTGALGAPALVVGLIEGLAEVTIAATSIAAGRASDRIGRVGFIRVGYLMPSIGKAIVALAGAWPVLLLGRVIDRTGKGLRGSARDALLVDAVDPSMRGRAFGLHRAMDTAGAVIGVLGAVVFLYAYRDSPAPEQSLRTALLVAAAIGIIAFLCTLPLRDVVARRDRPSTAEALPRSYWLALVPLALFGLANSSDAFLLLRCRDLGMAAWLVALAYAAYNVSAALWAYPAGAVSDRFGRRRVIAFGWALYALCYAGVALSTSAIAAWPLLVLYGASIACTDGAAKALIADHAPASARGRAMGIMQAIVGGATLAGNLVAGSLWDSVGPASAFWFGAAMAAVAGFSLLLLRPATASPRAG